MRWEVPGLIWSIFANQGVVETFMTPLTASTGSFKRSIVRSASPVKRMRQSIVAALIAVVSAVLLVILPAYGVPRPPASRSAVKGRGSAPRKQSPGATQQSASIKLTIRVVDENGVAVPSAVVTIEGPAESKKLKSETDYAGRVDFDSIDVGPHKITLEKEGFYAKTVDEAALEKGQVLEVVLDHQQELKEVIDVV